MKIYNNPPQNTWSELLSRPMMNTQHLERVVSEVIEAVKTSGDKALRDFTLKFDQVTLSDLEVRPEEIALAVAK